MRIVSRGSHVRRRRGICTIGDGHGIAGRRRGHHELPRGRIRIPSRRAIRRGCLWAQSIRPSRGVGAAAELILDDRTGIRVDFNSFASGDVLEVAQLEVGDVSLQERDTLEEVPLDTFGVTSSDKGLPVSVLLVALHPRTCAGGAPRMLGVALEDIDGHVRLHGQRERTGVCRRCRPTGLALIFLLLHLAHASCDLLNRRGSAEWGASPLSGSAFLRFLGAPGVWGCCWAGTGGCMGGCWLGSIGIAGA